MKPITGYIYIRSDKSTILQSYCSQNCVLTHSRWIDLACARRLNLSNPSIVHWRNLLCRHLESLALLTLRTKTVEGRNTHAKPNYDAVYAALSLVNRIGTNSVSLFLAFWWAYVRTCLLCFGIRLPTETHRKIGIESNRAADNTDIVRTTWSMTTVTGSRSYGDISLTIMYSASMSDSSAS